MVSTSTKFVLNKRTLSRKSVSTSQNEAFDKMSVSTSSKNCFRCQEQKKWKKIGLKLKNCVYQQKKAPSKSTKFLIYRKSVSTSQNEGFLEKFDFTGPKSYFHSNQYRKKIKKTVSSSGNKIFFKHWPPSNCNIGFQKNGNERISNI